MSRRLSRIDYDPALNAVDVVLSPPASHKYELLGITCFTDSVHAYEWDIFIYNGSTYVIYDIIKMPSTLAIEHRQYEGVPIGFGEQLVLVVATAGTVHIPTPITYIDVDFS